MARILVPSKTNSARLIEYCRTVFEPSPRYRSFFYFSDRKVKLVLDDFGDIDYPNGELHLAQFEVVPHARGCGLASIAMQALVEGADYFNVRLSLSPSSYETTKGLNQASLEAFYRRYGFRAERGSVLYEEGLGKVINNMTRIPKGLKR